VPLVLAAALGAAGLLARLAALPVSIGIGILRYRLYDIDRIISLSWFRIRFGMLQVKAYPKGEHVLRIEATVHNARDLRCRRSLDNFPEIITRLAGIAERFATTLDCADTSFLPDGILDQLPLPAQIGTARACARWCWRTTRLSRSTPNCGW